MGGRQYALGPARTVNGVHYQSFEEVAKPLLEEYGCLHFSFPILLGISRPAYTEEELAEYAKADNITFDFEGKKYTMYEGTQLQRKVETALRHQRDILNMAKAAGDGDTELIARSKIRMLTDKYVELSEVSGLPTQMERVKSAVKVVDKSNMQGYNRHRKTKNTGVFEDLEEPMQKRHIEKIIKEMDIDYHGIEIDIIRDEELIGTGICGYTFPSGKKVQLYPDAFSNREELVKTLGHERVHCEQVKLFGYSEDTEVEKYFEKGPVFSEEYWWSEYKRRTGYAKNG
jgi:hypothetical protein